MTSTLPRRAGLYCRISEHDERVPKVQNQEKDCRQHAASRGYVVADVYVDDGISASTGKTRPGWDRMKADVDAGLLDVLVAVDEDRFHRQAIDNALLQIACAGSGVVWDTVRGGQVDPATADGEFFSTMRAAYARMEVRKKSSRQIAANRHRRAAGLPLSGTRPFGFEKDRIQQRPDEVAEIRWAYATVLGTGKLYPVLKSWNDRGVLTSMGNKWSYATLQQLLRRARNAGLVEQDGEILENVQAVWEPIVSREDWQSVVSILSDPQRRLASSREPKHLLSGLVHCGTCGSAMRPSVGSDRHGHFKIYRCATKVNAQGDGRRHASVKMDELDPLVRKAVIDSYFIAIPNSLPSRDADVAELQNLHARLAEVRQGIEDLTDLVGTAGFNKARTAKRGAELAAEESTLEAKIDAHSRKSAHAAMLIDARRLILPKKGKVTFDDAARYKRALAQRFETLSLEQKRTLIRSLVKVTVHTGRHLAERVEVVHLGAPALDAEDQS